MNFAFCNGAPIIPENMMKIDVATSQLYSNTTYISKPIASKAENSVIPANGSTLFADMLSKKVVQSVPAESSEANNNKHADFTNMTRQEMFDWMNHQVRNGDMSLDESSPFLGMTMKISVATGLPVNMATDASRLNFVEKARQGIAAALSYNDRDLAERLQTAIKLMDKAQGKSIGVDAQA